MVRQQDREIPTYRILIRILLNQRGGGRGFSGNFLFTTSWSPLSRGNQRRCSRRTPRIGPIELFKRRRSPEFAGFVARPRAPSSQRDEKRGEDGTPRNAWQACDDPASVRSMDYPRADPTIRSFVAPSLLVVVVRPGIKSYWRRWGKGELEKKNLVLDFYGTRS